MWKIPAFSAQRSQQVVWLAWVLGALLALGATFLVVRDAQKTQQSELSTVTTYARMLEHITSSVVSDAESLLRALATSVSTEDARQASRRRWEGWSEKLQESVRGRAFLRSVSLLDEQGRVLASSHAANLQAKRPEWVHVPMDRTLSLDSRADLLPLQSGRDVLDAGEQELVHSRTQVLPLRFPVMVGQAEQTTVLWLVALINPDHVATQFERMLQEADGEDALRVLLLDLQGQLQLAVGLREWSAGMDLSRLSAFSRYLPQQEWVTEVSQGSQGVPVYSAFRVTRHWPLVIWVEKTQAPWGTRLMQSAHPTVWWVLLSWVLLALGTFLMRRALRVDERLTQELRESQSRQRAILHSALDGIITIDARGYIMDFNPAAQNLFGFTLEQAKGRLLHELIVPEHLRAQHVRGMQRLHETRQPVLLNQRVEVQAMRRDGHHFPIELTVVEVLTEQGPVYTATLRDLSERRRIENDLAAARERELHIGARIQSALLVAPASAIDIQGLCISTFNQASQGIDGDFIEIVRLGTHCLDIIAGDVMGKGVTAAMMGAATKLQISRCLAELLSTHPSVRPEPAQVVDALHRAMTPTLQELEAFVTLCYVRLDTEKQTLTWVGCGHEEPVLVRESAPPATACTVLSNSHPPLGILGTTHQHQQQQCPLQPGHTLLLYSDGITDAIQPTGERVGRERLVQAFTQRLHAHQTPGAMLHGLRSDILPQGVQLQDDVTLAVVQYLAGADRLSYGQFPITLNALTPVRHWVRESMQSASLQDPDASLFEVACVEVFTNIVRHAQGLMPSAPVELVASLAHPTADAAPALILEFIYLGHPFTPPPHLTPNDLNSYPEGGFGLHIISAACDDVQYLHHQGVNTVRLRKATGCPDRGT